MLKGDKNPPMTAGTVTGGGGAAIGHPKDIIMITHQKKKRKEGSGNGGDNDRDQAERGVYRPTQ